MNRYEFQLNISSEDYLDYYRGTARQVVARSLQGVVIQFPAGLLVPFVTHTGIRGRFVLTCDDQRRNATLRSLPDRAR